MRLMVALCLAIALFGCAAPHRMPDSHASHSIDSHASMAQSVLARCRLTLIDTAGKRISFNGTLIAQGDGLMRIETWKFTRPVVDVTLVDNQLWVSVGKVVTGSAREELRAAAGDMGAAWKLFTSDATSWGARLTAADSTEGNVEFLTTPAADGSQVLTTVSQATGLPSKHDLRDIHGLSIRSLEIREYEFKNGAAWPRQMVFRSSRGVITLAMSSLRMNAELPEDGFVPPAGAELLSQ